MKSIKTIFVASFALAVIILSGFTEADTCIEDGDMMEPPHCPPDNGLPTYFPYPYDCRQFFVCSNGAIGVCIRCPPGTVWDQELEVCNHEAVHPCVIVTTLFPPSTTTTEAVSTTNAETEGPSPTTGEPTRSTTETSPPPTTWIPTTDILE